MRSAAALVTIGPISASSSMPFLIFSWLRALGEQRHDPVGDVAHQHRHRDRHAALAGRAVGRADQRVDRLLEVGVGHHDHVVLGAAERLHALAVARAGLVDVAARSASSRRS